MGFSLQCNMIIIKHDECYYKFCTCIWLSAKVGGLQIRFANRKSAEPIYSILFLPICKFNCF
jgi:hypothetical protein